ncbi:hypothetical protein MLD38_033829 [Melastoma candidum]|uniref:Uncharacterized protein n=1 Tax=Melastoma candidum TaxID=119954 RepID=A0ACB9M8H0_9MYRT|nr:hypothetical protein MLD38_033829 [Melastoma candidum]
MTKSPRSTHDEANNLQVVRALDSLDELSDLSNGMKPGQSEIYDTREQPARSGCYAGWPLVVKITAPTSSNAE